MKVKFTIYMIITLLSSQLMFGNTPANSKVNGNGLIKGIVLDSASKTVMPYATVVIFDKKSNTVIDGVITKNNGEFAFEGLPLGEYNLKCTFLGYKQENIEGINITADNPQVMLSNVLLKSKDVLQNTIEVTGEKPAISYMLDKKVINISENPNVIGNRLADALQNIPSVSVDMEGKVSIRGSGNFQVLIDGKPSPMSGNDALKTIPVDAVEDVELITNPSAKYDPDGTAGIVNIILKKNSMNGLNGILNGSAGIKSKYSGDGQINYRFEKVNLYVGAEYQNMTFKPNSVMTREAYSPSSDTVNYINPSVDRKMIDKTRAFYGGIEYTIDPTRYISFSGNVYRTDYQRYLPSKLSEWTNPASSVNYYYNQDDFIIKGYYSTFNTFYKKSFQTEGHELSSMLNAIIWDGNGNETSKKSTTDKNFVPIDNNIEQHIGDADSRSFMIKFKTDYTRPISESYRLEAGYNFDYTQDFSDYLYTDYDNISKVWKKNDIYSNITKYYHSINAVYCTFTGGLWDFNYQLGLRGEYFNRRLTEATKSQYFKYEKANLFPSLNISRSFENDLQFQLSYSRRVQRPDVYALNPFPDYADDYVVSMGNPDLMPEYTDSYELNCQKGFESMFFSVQTYYRNTNNAISRVLKVKDDNKIWITSENVARSYALGLELAANINFSKKFRMNINGNFFNYNIETNETSVEGDHNGNVLNGNVMLFYSFTQNTLAQVNLFYVGPQYSVDGYVKETYSVGFSMKHSLYDKKLTLFISGRNLLNTMKYVSENRRKDYYAYSTFNTEGANLSLGFSWVINNYERKIRPEETIERTNVGASGGY